MLKVEEIKSLMMFAKNMNVKYVKFDGGGFEFFPPEFVYTEEEGQLIPEELDNVN